MEKHYILRKTLGPLKPGTLLKPSLVNPLYFIDDTGSVEFSVDTIKSMPDWFYEKKYLNEDYKQGYSDARKANQQEYQRGYYAGRKNTLKQLNDTSLSDKLTTQKETLSSRIYSLEESKPYSSKEKLL